ncbi:MAG: hypothetical protein ACHRHE_02195 [Tepidisphaerales bacterium]
MTLASLTLRGGDLWPVTAVAAALSLLAFLAAYPREVRQLPPLGRIAPPLLRGAAVVALLFSMLRPEVLRSRSVEEQGALVIVLDRSMSMGVADHALPPEAVGKSQVLGQLVAIAASLGRLGPEALPASVSDLESSLRRMESVAEEIDRAQRELDYAKLSGRGAADAQNRLDRSISELISMARKAEATARAMRSGAAEHFGRLANFTGDRETWIRRISQSLDRARREVVGLQDQTDEQVFQSNTQVREVCTELSRMSRLRLAWELIAGKEGLLSRLDSQTPVLLYTVGEGMQSVPLARTSPPVEPPATADQALSELGPSLRQVVASLGKTPVQALVLVTDGRQVPAMANPAALALPPGVPVFPVFAASEHVQDVAVTNVEMPSEVFAGETLVARMNVRSTNIEFRRLIGDAEISVDGEAAQSAPLRLRDKRIEAELSTMLDVPGVRRITLSVPQQEGEVSSANNQVERWVKVLPQKVKVTIVTGSAGWDFRYVRDALSRQPWIRLREAVVGTGNAVGMPAPELAEQSLLILFDVPREAMSAQQWQTIVQAVRERGLGLLIVPGLADLRRLSEGDPLAELLPFRAAAKPAWRAWPGQNPAFHFTPATGMEDASLLRLEEDPEASRRRWDDLPGFYRFLAIPELRLTARVLLTERESHLPLLTETRAGAGRVFYLATSETWRWRQRVGERDHERFWVQLVRGAIDRPYAAVSGELAFDADAVSAEPGQTVNLRARFDGAARLKEPPERLEVQVVSGGRKLATVWLHAESGMPGRYSGTAPELPLGEYELQLLSPAIDGRVEELPLPLQVERKSEAEMSDLTGDRAFLQGLADASGGRVLSLDQVHTLPQLLSEARRRHPAYSEIRLWDSGYLFVFVLSCLAGEWALRKQYGLA